MHRWAVYTTCWLFDCRGQTFMNKDVLGLLKATESWHLLALPSFIKAAITVCVFCLTTCKIIPVWEKKKDSWKDLKVRWCIMTGLENIGMSSFCENNYICPAYGVWKSTSFISITLYIAYALPYAIYTVWLASNIDVLCCILVKDIFYTGLLLDSTNLLSGFGEFCWGFFCHLFDPIN